MKTEILNSKKNQEILDKVLTETVNAMADATVARLLILKLSDICAKYIEESQKAYN